MGIYGHLGRRGGGEGGEPGGVGDQALAQRRHSLPHGSPLSPIRVRSISPALHTHILQPLGECSSPVPRVQPPPPPKCGPCSHPDGSPPSPIRVRSNSPALHSPAIGRVLLS